MNKNEISLLLGCILLCEIAGAIGGIFTANAIPVWYNNLNKPSFSPPNWVFGPAWTILYALMGASLFLILKEGFEKTRKEAIIFGAQLTLNVLWSIIFFGLKSPMFAFFDIIAMLAVILLTTAKFYKVSKQAAYLLIPYVIWVSFAAILNYFVWILN